MSVLHKVKALSITLILVFVFTATAWAKDYIEVWPEGWSEVIPLFKTSIFTDRFMVVHDQAGTSFLSVDGVYFRQLDLTYRLAAADGVEEEVVLRADSEIEGAFLGLDHSGGRHVVWLEKSPQTNSINYTSFGVPYHGHESTVVISTDQTIQDLAAVQVDQTTHLVWSQRDSYFQIKYAQIVDGNLTLLETVTDTTAISVRPSIQVGANDTVHVAWMETSPTGIEILHKSKTEGLWSKPALIGEGSVQDVQQGGRIALTCFGREVYAAWAVLPRNKSSLFVYLARSDDQGLFHSVPVGAGSKPQFLSNTVRPELVWQGVGAFGAQINHLSIRDDLSLEATNLTVGRKGAFRPEGFSSDGFLYVHWLQAEAEGGFRVYQINNQYPKHISFWRRVGIDESAPAYHLLFLLTSTFMLAIVYSLTSSGVIVVGALGYALLLRFPAYQKRSQFYRVILIATILLVARHLPIPQARPEYFGLVHYGLSFVLATVGSFLILRKTNQGSLFSTVAVFLLWTLLFQFFSLMPQAIVR